MTVRPSAASATTLTSSRPTSASRSSAFTTPASNDSQQSHIVHKYSARAPSFTRYRVVVAAEVKNRPLRRQYCSLKPRHGQTGRPRRLFRRPELSAASPYCELRKTKGASQKRTPAAPRTVLIENPKVP